MWNAAGENYHWYNHNYKALNYLLHGVTSGNADVFDVDVDDVVNGGMNGDADEMCDHKGYYYQLDN